MKVMQKSTDVSAAPIVAGEPEVLYSLATRFGTVQVDPRRGIEFPRGLPGFEGHKRFALVRLPQHDASDLMLLHSLDPADIGFLVFPYALDSDQLDRNDLETARKSLGIDSEDLIVVLIATFRREQDEVRASINLRAPLLIDTHRRLGWQHIFNADKYPIRMDVAA